MNNVIGTINTLLLDIFFPAACINCGIDGSYLCEDCFSLIDIFEDRYCPFCVAPKIVPDGRTCTNCRKSKKLNGLFCAASYENPIVRNLVHKFKYEPVLAKCLAKPLTALIITHFKLVKQIPIQTDLKDTLQKTLWIPVPLHKKKLKERGFNQSEELAKALSLYFRGSECFDALIKTRQTASQTDLPRGKREENVSGALSCPNPNIVRGRVIFLVDDVVTTGATIEECAKVLKKSGAKEVWGVTVARG